MEHRVVPTGSIDLLQMAIRLFLLRQRWSNLFFAILSTSSVALSGHFVSPRIAYFLRLGRGWGGGGGEFGASAGFIRAVEIVQHAQDWGVVLVMLSAMKIIGQP